jgi:hypothetical protein
MSPDKPISSSLDSIQGGFQKKIEVFENYEIITYTFGNKRKI